METDLIYVEFDEETFVIYPSGARVIHLYAMMHGVTDLQARDQLRSLPGLEGAVARPQQYAHYEDADIPLQAAVLAHGIAEGQVFVDGNKRVGLLAMVQFLELNGYTLAASQVERAQWMLELNADLTVERLAQRIRDNTHSLWE